MVKASAIAPARASACTTRSGADSLLLTRSRRREDEQRDARISATAPWGPGRPALRLSRSLLPASPGLPSSLHSSCSSTGFRSRRGGACRPRRRPRSVCGYIEAGERAPRALLSSMGLTAVRHRADRERSRATLAGVTFADGVLAASGGSSGLGRKNSPKVGGRSWRGLRLAHGGRRSPRSQATRRSSLTASFFATAAWV